MEKRNCPICNTEFSFPAWAEKHGRGKTCSPKCRRVLTSQKLKGRNTQIAEKPCAQCGKVMQMRPFEIDKRSYCSKECSAESQMKRKEINCDGCGKTLFQAEWQYIRSKSHFCRDCANKPNMKACDFCHKEIHVSPSAVSERNFCGHACYQGWRKANGIARPRIREDIPCDRCGTIISLQPNQVRKNKHHYCTAECFAKAHQERMSGELNPSWRGGFDRYYGPNWKRQARAARARDGYKCCHCGISESDAGYTLHVHHVVPLRKFKRDFRKANALSNLLSLCRTCHTTEEWKSGRCS